MEKQIRYSMIVLLACVAGIFVGLAVNSLEMFRPPPSALLVAVVFGVCAAFLSGIILSGLYRLSRYILGRARAE